MFRISLIIFLRELLFLGELFVISCRTGVQSVKYFKIRFPKLLVLKSAVKFFIGLMSGTRRLGQTFCLIRFVVKRE